MIKGLIILFAYFVIALLILLALKRFTKLSDELIRKLFHLVIAMAVHVYVFAFALWWHSIIAIIVFVLLVYPIIMIFEKIPHVMNAFNERKQGEIKSSLLIVQFMIGILIFVFWGIMGDEWKYISVAAIMAWCFGDGAAALIGKKWGRHKLSFWKLDGKKSLEGTLSCSLFSSLASFLVMLVYSNNQWELCFVAACFVGPICAITELFSNEGNDTISMPLAACIPIALVMFYFK